MKRPHYKLQPLVFPAQVAHSEGNVVYAEDGSITLRHPSLSSRCGSEVLHVAPYQQFSCIFPTFLDLSKALSSTANSPGLETGRTLRQTFDEEFSGYRTLVEECRARGGWEPDYGSYVFDASTRRLYLIAPEFWHRIALTTSGGALLLDPEKKLHWRQVRTRLENAVIGVVGTSVGSNVVEALSRELRPKRMKLADPDWLELTNLNRIERCGVPELAMSRQARRDPRNCFEVHRCNKAELTAYQQNLVDPYADFFVYPSGVDERNLDQFLLGADGEPAIDLLVEEADDISLKVLVRERCRQLGIPVLMMTDFGHVVAMHFQNFAQWPNQWIAHGCDDVDCKRLLDRCMTTGNRDDLFEFVTKFVGSDCVRDEFATWVQGDGEQPTSSLPQSGATAMIAGGIAAKAVARHLLGHQLPARIIHDFAAPALSVEAQIPGVSETGGV